MKFQNLGSFLGYSRSFTLQQGVRQQNVSKLPWIKHNVYACVYVYVCVRKLAERLRILVIIWAAFTEWRRFLNLLKFYSIFWRTFMQWQRQNIAIYRKDVSIFIIFLKLETKNWIQFCFFLMIFRDPNNRSEGIVGQIFGMCGDHYQTTSIRTASFFKTIRKYNNTPTFDEYQRIFFWK